MVPCPCPTLPHPSLIATVPRESVQVPPASPAGRDRDSISSCSSPCPGCPQAIWPPGLTALLGVLLLLGLPQLGLLLRTATAAGSCPSFPLGPITHSGWPLPPLGPTSVASWVLPGPKTSLVSLACPCKHRPARIQQLGQGPAQMQPRAPSWALWQDCLDASGFQNCRKIASLC